MKTWPIDPLGLRNIQLEVSEKLPQGELACGSQAFIATLLFDSSMSAPIIEAQKSQSVTWSHHVVTLGGWRVVWSVVLPRGLTSHLISSHLIFSTSSPLLSSHFISSHLISAPLLSPHLFYIFPAPLISSHLISSHLISAPLLSSHLLSPHFIS